MDNVTICLVVAAVLFAVAALASFLGEAVAKVPLIALGLLFTVIAFIVERN